MKQQLCTMVAIIALTSAISPVGGLYGMDRFLKPQTSVDIKHISIKDKSDLSSKGYMKIPFLARLLDQAYEEKKLPLRAFKNPKDLPMRKLGEAEKEAPWGTTQLFLIQTPEQSFILKGMKNDREIKSLVKSIKTQNVSQYIYPNNNNKYPQFIFPVANLSYTDKNNNKHYLELMPMAPGVSLSDLMKKFAANSRDRSVIRHVAYAYYDFGAAMAQFYKATGQKITHGDLHHGNVFYDKKTRRITLIDNNCVAGSSEKTDLSRDIAFALLKSMYVVEWTDKDVLKQLNLDEWYSLYLSSFITGYLSVFPKKDRRRIFNWLERGIKNYKDPENGSRWYANKSILGFDHKKYMERTHDKLSSSKILFEIDKKTVNDRDKDTGKTLLHKAALRGEWRLIWPLIVSGADTEMLDKDLNTPLHEASYFNHPEAIKALVKAKAELNALDIEEYTPLDKALSNNSKSAVELLRYYGARPNRRA